MRSFRLCHTASLLFALSLIGLTSSHAAPQGTVTSQIDVRVFQPNGETVRMPPVLVDVTKYDEGPMILMPSPQKPEEDTAGSYRFTVKPGEYYVRAGDSAGDFIRTYFPNTTKPEEAKPIHVSPGERFTADIHLSPAPKFRITGRIVDLLPDREPHHYAGVSLHSSSPIAREYKLENPYAGLPVCCDVESVSDLDVSVNVENDRFEISGVRAGDYLLAGTIVVGDYKPGTFIMVPAGKPFPYSQAYSGRIPVKVENGDVNGLTIEVAHGIDLKGQFVSNGKRLNFDTTVLFFSDDTIPGTSNFTMARKDGTFVIPNLAAGTYRIRVGTMSDNSYIEEVRQGERRLPDTRGITIYDNLKVSVQKENTETLRIVVNPDGGIISGKINNKKEATLVLVPADEPVTNRYRCWIESTSSGDFKISGIPPGRYRVYAFRKGSKAASGANPLKFAEEIVGKATLVTVDPGRQIEVRLNRIDTE